MKLLRKIAPFAISALMVGSMAAAADIHSWKSTFTAANTAVVVGSGSIGTEDMAAALTVAKAVGIDTTTTSGGTVTGESYKFEKSSTKLTLNATHDELNEIRGTITKDQMPTTLADEIYKDADNTDYDYTQKVTVGADLPLSYFAERKYKGEKTPVLGFDLAKDTHVMNYTLTFSDMPTFDNAHLSTTMIKLLGKEYYISASGSYADGNKTLTLLDTGVAGSVVEGQTATIGGKTVSIVYVTSDNKVKLNVGSEQTTKLSIGGTYKLSDGTYVGVKDVFYNAKDNGVSSAEVSVGNGKIYISDGAIVELNDKDITGLNGYLENDTTYLKSITLQWNLDKISFITPDSEIVLPGFENVKFLMTGMNFPTGSEEIAIEPNGDEIVSITAPIKDGEVTIDLLSEASGAGHFDYVGSDANTILKTSNTTTLTFNETAKDTYFVASYAESQEAESYYLSASFGGDAVNGYTTTVHNEVTNTDVCTDKKTSGECTIGNVELTFTTVGEDYFTATIAAGGSFNKLYTAKGALFYLPYNTVNENVTGYVDLTGSPGYWNLTMIEADKDGNLASGDTVKYNLSFNTDKYTTVSGITGVTLISTGDSDHQTGYVASDLATFIAWDKSGTEYSATATYYGDVVSANVYIASASAAAGGGSTWTPVKDTETTAYSSKNVIAIGGTAVNKVARKILGFTDDTVPVYGTDAAWKTATGVDGVGKGILDLVASPYSTGNFALLVAGYEGPDTSKTADFLTIKYADVAAGKMKVLVDTINVVEAGV